jgi:hypothetical protein
MVRRLTESDVEPSGYHEGSGDLSGVRVSSRRCYRRLVRTKTEEVRISKSIGGINEKLHRSQCLKLPLTTWWS